MRLKKKKAFLPTVPLLGHWQSTGHAINAFEVFFYLFIFIKICFIKNNVTNIVMEKYLKCSSNSLT